MSENLKLVPKRRFKEFQTAGDWEQRKLGEVAKYRNGKAHENDIDENGKYIVVNSKFVSSDGEVWKFSNSQNEPLYKSELAFVLSDVPNGRAIARTFLVDKSDKYSLNQRIAGITPLENTYPYFLHILMNRNRYFLQFDDGAKQTNLSVDDVMKFEEFYPQIDEQQAIGEYFKQLDNLIALHQRKLKKMKALKSAYLSEMFPAEGDREPKRRFAGFTDAWEQRKLRDLCIKFTDGDWIESKDQSDSGVRLIQTGNVGVAEYLEKSNSTKWISEDTFERLHCEEVLPGDILISRLPEPAGRACIMPFLGMKMVTAVDCTIVRTASDCSNKFLIQNLSAQKYFNEVNTALAGGTRQRISRSSLAIFDIPIPVQYEEQEAIGGFFERLDNLITLHRRKLEKLQNIKQAYLNEMFL